MVSSKELGKLKLEYILERGIFISGKNFWLRDSNGKYYNKAKGIKPSSLSYIDYMNLLNGIYVTTATRAESKTNRSKGEVGPTIIKPKGVNRSIPKSNYIKLYKGKAG